MFRLADHRLGPPGALPVNPVPPWSSALQKSVKRERAVYGDDHLAVQHKGLRAQVTKAGDQFRKVSRKWLARLGLENHLVLGAKYQAPKPVPFRFGQPSPSGSVSARVASIGA